MAAGRGHRRRRSHLRQADRGPAGGKITTSITRAYNNGAEDRGRESSLSNLIAQQMVEVGERHRQQPRRHRDHEPWWCPQRPALRHGRHHHLRPGGGHPALRQHVEDGGLHRAQVKRILEEQWQPVSASRPFLALGLSKNVTYTYDPNRAQGDRISGIYLDGTPIDPAKVYSVTSSSFLVTNVGTAPDNFATMLQGANYRDTGLPTGTPSSTG